MNVNRVVTLLRELEGWRDYVYDDKSPWPRTEVSRLECRYEAGQYKVNATGGTATIGYGETGSAFIDLYWGRRITQDEALAKMAERVDGFYRAVSGCIDADLTEHQWEAITCRAYQTGAGGFCRSTVAQALNEGDVETALTAWRRNFAHPDRSEVEIAHFLTADKEYSPMKFVSRSEWGARNAGLTPLDVGMVSIHWEGPHMGTPEHSRCASIVKGFQDYHVDTMGWADIAYNAVVCPHGFVFEGRGQGKRSAANGDTASNSASYAICFMGGEGDTFTDEAKDGINDAAEWLVGPGARWGVHRDWVSTACPGEEITAWVRGGHPRSSEPTPEPVPEPEEAEIMIIIGDAPPERGGGVWQSDGIVRKPVRTGDTWAQLGDDGARVAKHIGVFNVGTFDDLIDIEASLSARIVVTQGEGGAIDYAELARKVADELHGRLAG